ncbi:ABC transporter substrate binding protein [Rhodovibrionaceae bacterium A322]
MAFGKMNRQGNRVLRLSLFLWLLVALVLAVPVGAGHGQARAQSQDLYQPRPVFDWVDYDTSLEAYYTFEMNADGDSARHRVTSVATAEDGSRKHLMLLLPKKSRIAYSTTLNTTLFAFQERGMPAQFDIWFFDQIPEVAFESIRWAEEQEVDLILSIGSVSTAFLHENYKGGKLPVVTSASKDPVQLGQMPDYEQGSGTNIAYTSINVPIESQMIYLFRLLPELKNIWVLYAQSNTSAVQTQVLPLKAVAPQYNLTVGEVAVRNKKTVLEDLTKGMPEAVAKIKELDPDLKHSIFWVTGSTSVYRNIGLIDDLSGGVPVLAALPDVVRPGRMSAAISIGINQSSGSYMSAVYAMQVLSGEVDVGDLPVGVVSPPDIAINFMKTRNYGMTVPFSFFEAATFIYDYDGRMVRSMGHGIDLIN